MRRILIGLLSLAAAGPISAQTAVDSPRADQTYLTIYPDNLAMITEVRRVTLPKGRVTLRLLGVSDEIIAQTAVLQSFDGLSLERNFSSDLITKGALLNNAVGEMLTIRRLNPATGEIATIDAKLVSASQRPESSNIQGAVFDTGTGIEALECAGLYETVLFSRLPDTLNPAPVLSMDVLSDSAGEKEIVISYLSQGIGWQADYRLDVKDGDTEGALSGWITLTNSTSKSFENVPTAIIAGEVNRDPDTRADAQSPDYYTPSCWPKGTTKAGTSQSLNLYGGFTSPTDRQMTDRDAVPAPMMSFATEYYYKNIIVTGAKRQAAREDLGDYKLYRTPQPVTVAAHQTKQIAFLAVPDAEIERRYTFELAAQIAFLAVPDAEIDGRYFSDFSAYLDGNLRAADIEYEIDNSLEGHLAQPLPRGTVRVLMTRPNGQTAFLGEDEVRDLAVDLPVEIDLGKSQSVKMRDNFEGVNDGRTPYIRISGDIFNGSPDDIIARIEINDDRFRADQIGRESHARDPEKIVPTYDIAIPALSQDAFFAEFPAEQIFNFDRSDIVYEQDARGDTDTLTADNFFQLAGQNSSNRWVDRFFEEDESHAVTLTAKLLSVDTFAAVSGEERYRFTERLSFKNTSASPAKIRLDYADGKDVKLVRASQNPETSAPLVWIMTVPAGGTADLTVTAEADDVL